MKTQIYTKYRVLKIDINLLNKNQIKEILSADWFEPTEKFNRGMILINLNQLSQEIQEDFFDEDNEPFNFGVNCPEDNTKIDDCLKRWNKVDGFYHA